MKDISAILKDLEQLKAMMQEVKQVALLLGVNKQGLNEYNALKAVLGAARAYAKTQDPL